MLLLLRSLKDNTYIFLILVNLFISNSKLFIHYLFMILQIQKAIHGLKGFIGECFVEFVASKVAEKLGSS